MGSSTAVLPGALAGEPFTLSAALLTQGFHDPDGDPLTVSGLSTELGDWFADNGDGTFSIDPTAAGYDPAYVGPLELHYTVADGHGHSLAASQLLLVQPLDHAATGSLSLSGVTQEGESLVASLSNLVDADGATTVAYRWQTLKDSSWSDITGEVGATLAIPLGQNLAGAQVRVVATTSDPLGGTTEFFGEPRTVTQAPPPAPSFALLADTGSSASDGLINNGTIQVSGLIAGNLWQVSLNGGPWTAGSGSSFTLAAGSYGPGSIAVRQSSAAGVSPSATNAAAITVDRSAPLAPTLALVADTGKSATDRITGNSAFAVGQLEAGACWEVSFNGGASWSAGSGAGFSAPDGNYAAGVIAVRQRDAAGNLGAPRATTASFTIDIQAPVSQRHQQELLVAAHAALPHVKRMPFIGQIGPLRSLTPDGRNMM